MPDISPVRVFSPDLNKVALQGEYSLLSSHDGPKEPTLVPPFKEYVEGEADVYEIALESLKNGVGVLIQGGPGCGKSFMANKLIKALEGPVHKMSRTHVTSRTIQGDTTQRFLHEHKSASGILFVDELFLHEYALISRLHHYSLLGVTFLMTGDDMQLEAIGNHHCGTPLGFDRLGKSDLLKIMCPVKITLTKNKRSDDVIHSFCTECRTKSKEEMVRKAREIFSSEAKDPTHLVLSNYKRRKLNVESNDKFEGLLIEGVDTPMRLYKGLMLQGCTPSKSRGICNGILYEVVSLFPLVVKDELDEYEVTLEFAKKNFKLAYARTIFQAQSQTIHGPLQIHDVDNPIFNVRHLLTAVSRATHHSLVSIK